MLTGSRAGWSFEATTGEVMCTEGRPLKLTTVRKGLTRSRRASLVFRRPKSGCEDCTDRPDCLRTDRVGASKHAEFSVNIDTANDLRDRLALNRGRSDEPRTEVRDVDPAPGPRAVRDALFLPARARQLHRALFVGATMRAVVHNPTDKPVLSLVARDTADRQRRRKTWAHNLARYALPAAAHVHIEVACRDELRAWMNGRQSRHLGFGGTV